MLRNGIASTAVLAALLLTQAANAAELTNADCWRAEEAKAAQIQNLKTMLMFDALKCQDTLPATVDSYNGFLDKRHDLIVSSKNRVREHFLRLLGPAEGYTASDRYETRAGNRAASGAIDPERCETTGMYARLAANASEDDLVAMAGLLAKDTEVATCRGDTPALSRPARMVIPVWEKKAPAFAKAATQPLPAVEGPPVAPAVPGAVPAVAVVANAAPAAVPPVPAPAPAPVVPAPALVEAVATAPAPAAAPQPVVVAAVSAPATSPEAPAADRAETLKTLQALTATLAQIAVTLQTGATPPTRPGTGTN